MIGNSLIGVYLGCHKNRCCTLERGQTGGSSSNRIVLENFVQSLSYSALKETHRHRNSEILP